MIKCLVILTETNVFWKQGFVTAAQKLQRKTIINHFKKDIERCYGKK